MKIRVLSAIALIVVALGVPAAPATATAVEDVDPQVAYALQVEPGGIAVDYWHAVWPDLDMTLTVQQEQLFVAAAVGSCASGRVCAFNGYGATGSFLSWSTCGSHPTSALSGSVRSIANARSSGTLQARNGTTVVATAGPGSSTNVYSTVTNIYC